MSSLGLSLLACVLIAQTISSPVGTGRKGDSGDGGPAAGASLNQPFDLVFDSKGNLFFSDTGNHRVRFVDAGSGVISTVAGNGSPGFSGDGGPAPAAQLNEPYGLALDESQNHLYIVDRLNRRIRRVDLETRRIETFAGNGTDAYSGDGGPAIAAGLVEPNDAVVDRPRARLLIADVAGHRVRSVGLGDGIIMTLAGDGRAASTGDGGAPAQASLNGPRALAITPDGHILILERNGNRLRTIRTRDGRTTIEPLAGSGTRGNAGDNGPMEKAAFDGPKELAVDPAGNIYIVDTENHAIRRIDAGTRVVTTVIGDGSPGGIGDGGPAREAQLDRPHGVAIAPDGSIWVGDTNNHRLRQARP